MENQNLTTNQDIKQVDMNRNPSGKGGFGEHPENINRDPKILKNEQRFSYWLPFFKSLTAKEFIQYAVDKKEEDMYVAEVISYERVANSRKDLAEYKDLADRTEGKAISNINLKGEVDLNAKIQSVEKLIDDIITVDKISDN